jgi:xylulokinase
MTEVLLGIDAGTSSVKVVATDLHGRRLRDHAVAYPIRTDGAEAEQDAEEWWSAVCVAVRTVAVGMDPVAVAVTSQAPTLVPVDDDGAPTGPALTWLDRRATAEAKWIAALAPAARNGADPFFGTAKIAWMETQRPDSLRRARYVLSTNGFLVMRLTGVAALDDTTASLMQGFDEEQGQFDSAIRSAIPGLSALPPVVSASTAVGKVTGEAATQTGLRPGTPVVAGGIDAVGSALEAGALLPGDPLVDMTGFSSVTILAVPARTAIPGFIHARHCIPNTDLLITAQVTAGATIDWVNSWNPQQDLRSSEQLLSRERPGRVMMVPSLAGERTPSWNPHARGVLAGFDLSTDGTDIMLAAMEGNALALARDVAAVRAAGFEIDRMVSTGGGARSDAWLQIKADVLGVPVHRPYSGHGAAHGAALLAGLARGYISSLEEVRAQSVQVERTFNPNASRHRAYAEKQKRFGELLALNSANSTSEQ